MSQEQAEDIVIIDVDADTEGSIKNNVLTVLKSSSADALSPRIRSFVESERDDIYRTKQFGTEIKQKFAIVVLSSISLILLGFTLNQSVYKLFASAACVIFAAFIGNLIYLLLRARNLHRICTVTKKISDFGNIVFVTEIKEYPNSPIKSISELFAIRGSNIAPLFLAMCCFISAIYSCAVSLHWLDIHQNAFWIESYTDKEYIELYFALFSCVATGVIGNFDLNPYDKVSMFMHYVGVLFMALSIFAYCISTDWSTLSIALVALAFVSWGVWIICCYCVYPHRYEISDSEDIDVDRIRKQVHRASVVCLLLETAGCLFASACNMLYLWNIQDVKDMIEYRQKAETSNLVPCHDINDGIDLSEVEFSLELGLVLTLTVLVSMGIGVFIGIEIKRARG